MRPITVIALFALATASVAQEKESLINKIGELGKASASSVKSHARSATGYQSSIRVVLAKDTIIQPGAFKDYGEVPVDFNGSEDVAISISAPNSNLTGATILVAWAAPDEFFVLTDEIKGSTLAFPVNGGGGGRVPVYGSALRILVANDGTAPITIRQLAVYAK